MKHAREDYDAIQDPRGLIPEDEPVFMLRAQDIAAPAIVELWAAAVYVFGAEEKIIDAALAQANRMRDWQKQHGHKIPDMP